MSATPLVLKVSDAGRVAFLHLEKSDRLLLNDKLCFCTEVPPNRHCGHVKTIKSSFAKVIFSTSETGISRGMIPQSSLNKICPTLRKNRKFGSKQNSNRKNTRKFKSRSKLRKKHQSNIKSRKQVASDAWKNFDFDGFLTLNHRYFWEEGLYEGQKKNNPSASIQQELKYSSENSQHFFSLVPFYRYDAIDNERTHFDIRELEWVGVFESWELALGIRKIFWGATESYHLVDVINQKDLIEDLKGDEKLGQPMASVVHSSKIGNLGMYAMPLFRKRVFAGKNGRFRLPLLVYNKEATYESKEEEKHLDFAVRYFGSISSMDLGLSYFKGTSREPELRILQSSSPPPTEVNDIDRNSLVSILRPHYYLMDQVGLDLQLALSPVIFKLEAIHRTIEPMPYNAAVVGFEYAVNGIFGSLIDTSYYLEYLYDKRDNDDPLFLQNDLFLGTRLVINDFASTEIFIGSIIDLDTFGSSSQIAMSRRFFELMKLELNIQNFELGSTKRSDHLFIQDSYGELIISFFW